LANSLPKRIVESLDKEVRNQLELAGAMTHPGESGRGREQVIAGFVRKLVPYSIGVDSGFVIDAQGQISKQIDIVVYRTDYHPVFNIGGVKHFLVESVLAVIENKARITSIRALDAALENIASVKRLDRTNKGRNHVVIGSSQGPEVQADEFQHQVFGAIVAQKSMAKPKLQQKLLEFCESHVRREWFNMYIDVNAFSVAYARAVKTDDSVERGLEDAFIANTSMADRLAVTDKSSAGFVPPLADLAQELVNFIRVAPIIDFLPTSYLWDQSGRIDWHTIRTA